VSDPASVRRARLRAQRLHPGHRAPAGVAGVGAAVTGLQAQSWPAAQLAVRARSDGLTAADVDAARVADRSVVRAWFMRGTLHLVPAADVRWLLDLLAPVLVPGQARRRRQLGIDGAAGDTGVRAILEALAAGPLTKAELTDAVLAAGVDVDPRGQAVPHLLWRAAVEGDPKLGRVCFGPDRGAKPSWVRLDDWVGPGIEPDGDPAAELARRYLAGHAPAGPEDFASWSGLPMPVARAALAAAGPPGDPPVDGGRAGVRLLGAFDDWLLGWAGRGGIVGPDHERRVWPGGGILRPVVVDDGRIVATWTLDKRRARTVARISPFGTPSGTLPEGVEAEVADLGRFLGTDVGLETER
jgi:hypothetical protein